MQGPLPAGQVCHGAGGALGGPVLLPLGWLPPSDRARARRVVLGVVGFPWGSGPVPCAGVRCRGICSGWVLTAPVFVGLGMAPLPSDDARCPEIPVALWCCVGCRCAARLGSPSCRGLCGVSALDGAGLPVVCMALVARCWCDAATGVGGAEVDGLGDVEDVAADVRARTFLALVAVVARDRGGRVVMVAVVLQEGVG